MALAQVFAVQPLAQNLNDNTYQPTRPGKQLNFH